MRHFAFRMSNECGRLTHLVADLIDLSRLQGDQPLDSAKPTSVDWVVSEAVDMLATAARNAEIEVVTGGEAGLMVYGVEDQLVTAVRNLLSNAIAYSSPQTRVAIGVAERDGIVNISVTDQGIGIAESDLDRIFERFYRVDPARSRITGGTGLGLAIVKHVCNNHGGDVTVWSVEGRAARSRCGCRPTGPGPTPPPRNWSWRSQIVGGVSPAMKVLVVDDEESIGDALAYVLSKEGFEVKVAVTGPEGLAAFEDWAPDMVLLDVMLPGMSGTEVCKAIRSTSAVPIIMLTARTRRSTRSSDWSWVPTTT